MQSSTVWHGGFQQNNLGFEITNKKLHESATFSRCKKPKKGRLSKSSAPTEQYTMEESDPITKNC